MTNLTREQILALDGAKLSVAVEKEFDLDPGDYHTDRNDAAMLLAKIERHRVQTSRFMFELNELLAGERYAAGWRPHLAFLKAPPKLICQAALLAALEAVEVMAGYLASQAHDKRARRILERVREIFTGAAGARVEKESDDD